MYTDHNLANEPTDNKKSPLRSLAGSKVISGLANIAWNTFQVVNTRLPEGESIQPKWAPGKSPSATA